MVTETIQINCCPVCGGTRFRPMRKGTYKDMEATYGRCPTCGLTYWKPFPADTVLASYYSTHFSLPSGQPQKAQYKMTLAIDFLSRYKYKTLLEVGCGQGHALVIAKQQGFDVTGIEIDTRSVKQAAKLYGMHLLVGSPQDVDALTPDRRYDVICAFDVLEHLNQPNEALDKMISVLEPKGALVLTTHNMRSIFSRLFGEQWRPMISYPGHLTNFTPESLLIMLQKHGLRAESMRCFGFQLNPPYSMLFATLKECLYLDCSSVRRIRPVLLKIVALLLYSVGAVYNHIFSRWSQHKKLETPSGTEPQSVPLHLFPSWWLWTRLSQLLWPHSVKIMDRLWLSEQFMVIARKE